jgi:hypothetical protein
MAGTPLRGNADQGAISRLRLSAKAERRFGWMNRDVHAGPAMRKPAVA